MIKNIKSEHKTINKWVNGKLHSDQRVRQVDVYEHGDVIGLMHSNHNTLANLLNIIGKNILNLINESLSKLSKNRSDGDDLRKEYPKALSKVTKRGVIVGTINDKKPVKRKEISEEYKLSLKRLSKAKENFKRVLDEFEKFKAELKKLGVV